MLQKGDVVEVRGIVRWDQTPQDNGMAFISVANQNVHIKADDLVLVHPGFEVGDAAIYAPNQIFVCEIVAIHGEQAWLIGDFEGIIDMFELTRPAIEDDPNLPAPIGDAGVILPATDDSEF